MSHIRRPFVLALMIGLAVLTVLGTSGSLGRGVAAPASQVTLTLYNAQHVSLAEGGVKAFTAQSGIRVEMGSGNDSALGTLLVQEGSVSPADVFITENSPAM